VWEEYRYDPLGRRVAVRTLRPTALCNQPAECYNSTTYFVWAGDQLLWEIRAADATNNEHAGGIVSYFQAGGIDRPLTIWKSGIGTVVTHQSWRGQFARGTFGNGPRAGESSDCTEYPATNGCIPVRWPGWNTTAWSQEAAKPATTGAEEFWFGSLSVGMRDASGQQYMRNRYYNSQTGQFTQPDPIGLAGGLNSYGFAAGDPVSYDDPFGLKMQCNTQEACDLTSVVAFGCTERRGEGGMLSRSSSIETVRRFLQYAAAGDSLALQTIATKQVTSSVLQFRSKGETTDFRAAQETFREPKVILYPSPHADVQFRYTRNGGSRDGVVMLTLAGGNRLQVSNYGIPTIID
jgi:RHS repeat-associated protein